ncbi:MAG: hypothetical protein DI629_14645 [Mesorhizobium amorphae]|nr:MAG: hypothetical protein DI629_14645 [Mesorhizobium amorphae]
MSERTEGVSAAVIPFPGNKTRRDKSMVSGGSLRGTVQTLRPILSTDGWYHDVAMREEARGLHS